MDRTAIYPIESIISRYAGRIPNLDIFNEAFHGDLFVRYFGADIWQRIIVRARELDGNVQLAFNDYQVVRRVVICIIAQKYQNNIIKIPTS